MKRLFAFCFAIMMAAPAVADVDGIKVDKDKKAVIIDA